MKGFVRVPHVKQQRKTIAEEVMDYKKMKSYNKARALQELETAKQMITVQDYAGAKIKLLEVRRLYPDLENISGMLTVCDILSGARLDTVCCGTDWYRILQVTSTAEYSHIQFQFQKLLLLIDPLKNNFPGTSAALKITRYAFSVLSDPKKRAAFDSRSATLGAFGSKNSETCDVDLGKKYLLTDCSAYGNGSSPVLTKSKIADAERLEQIIDRGCSSKRIMAKRNSHQPSARKIVVKLSIQSEVPKIIHRNEERKHIISQETGQSAAHRKISINELVKMPENSLVPTMELHIEKHFCPLKPVAGKLCDTDFIVGQVWAAYDKENMPRNYFWIKSIDQLPFRLHCNQLKHVPHTSDENKWCDAGLPVVCGLFNVDKTEKIVTGLLGQVFGNWENRNISQELVAILTDFSHHKGLKVAALCEVEGMKNVFKISDDDCFSISAKDLYRFSHPVPATRIKGVEMERIADEMFELDPLALPHVLNCKASKSLQGTSENASSLTLSLSSPSHHPIQSIPKTEALKLEWSAKDFSSGQVWTLYDAPNSMPRRYAVVQKVVSANEVCVSFLEPCPNENLPIACGLFRAARTITNVQIRGFSQPVMCERAREGSFYHIFPRKGEIWAVYKNWNNKWKQINLSESQCLIVEIISDLSEGTDIKMANLVEVPGFLTFFHKGSLLSGDQFAITCPIAQANMFRFSHQIPAYKVPGIEQFDIPKHSWHLEPDALPRLGNLVTARV
ncbi:DnaJ domain [Dillenia turbinata]|uniref:DnaJ domain n=1 Tax=Dillenia turbinata TaxID=194707 RepID=A0AAN8UKL4_9MAGN